MTNEERVIAGKRSADILRSRDPDYFVKLGQLGGKKGKTGGFHYLSKNDPDRLRTISAKGGLRPRRRRTASS